MVLHLSVDTNYIEPLQIKLFFEILYGIDERQHERIIIRRNWSDENNQGNPRHWKTTLKNRRKCARAG